MARNYIPVGDYNPDNPNQDGPWFWVGVLVLVLCGVGFAVFGSMDDYWLPLVLYLTVGPLFLGGFAALVWFIFRGRNERS